MPLRRHDLNIGACTKENIIRDKTKAFAIRIVRLYQLLMNERHETILSKQLLRSGTSIGANVKEGITAISRKEFLSKLIIAYKEANETEYWLELLHETDYLTNEQYESIVVDCREIIRILTSILKTTSEKNEPH